MNAIRIARSVVAFTFVISIVLATAACTDEQSASADPVQPTGTDHVQPTGPDHVMVNPADLKWADAPAFPAGVRIAVIEGPLDQPVPFTLRLQFPADYQLPAHWHPGIEHITVLSGAINMGVGDRLDKTSTTALPAGSMVIVQPNTNHFLWTAEEATVQVHGVGPTSITYVNPADDPRTK